MANYWIILDAEQLGPFTADELRRNYGHVLSAETPVWHDGLADWVTLGEVEELTGIITPPAGDGEQPVELPPIPYTTAPMPDPGYRIPPAAVNPTFRKRPEPPTYLVWNIIATILCCLPTGVVGIIMSSKVSRRYDLGDFRGARKASEAAAWWLLVSVVLGLVSLPFQILVTLF